MKSLLALTAIIETATEQLALLIVPSAVVLLLLGSPLDTSAAVTLGRVAGTALLTLTVAFWLARGDPQSRAARGLVAAMVLYNAGVALILATAGVRSHLFGVALRPAVVLHAAMTFWCIVNLVSGNREPKFRSSAG